MLPAGLLAPCVHRFRLRFTCRQPVGPAASRREGNSWAQGGGGRERRAVLVERRHRARARGRIDIGGWAPLGLSMHRFPPIVCIRATSRQQYRQKRRALTTRAEHWFNGIRAATFSCAIFGLRSPGHHSPYAASAAACAEPPVPDSDWWLSGRVMLRPLNRHHQPGEAVRASAPGDGPEPPSWGRIAGH